MLAIKYEYFQTDLTVLIAKIMKKLILSVLLCLCLTGVSFKSMSQNQQSYLALGDSYTIGEAVESDERWPVVLANTLSANGLKVSCDKIIATTGWTTDELLDAVKKEEETLLEADYDVVSLLIGVNNQYRGYPIEQYKKEFEVLLKKALAFAGEKSKSVFVLSIPDYGVTPFAKENDKDIQKIKTELESYNKLAQEICEKYEVHFYDITPISLKAQFSELYVAKDGLHPSAKMYEEWVDYVHAAIYRQLK